MVLTLSAPAVAASEVSSETSVQSETAEAQTGTAAPETQTQTEPSSAETAAQSETVSETLPKDTTAQTEVSSETAVPSKDDQTETFSSKDTGKSTSESDTAPATEAASETGKQSDTHTEISYPAFSDTLSVSGMNVQLDAAEGVLPEGTRAVVTPASAQDAIDAVQKLFEDEVVDAAAVDISFVYNGNEIEPAGSDVRVSLSLNDKINGDEQHVVHIMDNGEVEEMNAISVDGASASFDADSFSIYAIVGTDAVTRRTYRFFNGDKLVDTQIVKNGDTLEEPGKPEKDGYVFTGWVDKDGKDFSGFGTISDIPEHAADEEVLLYAKFQEAYYVTFHGMDGSIINQMKGADKETIDISGLSFQTPSGEYLSGWTTKADMTEEESGLIKDSVTISGKNMDLYPVVKDVVWVLFDGNDQIDGDTTTLASITPAQCVRQGESAQKPEDPTRPGYVFKGWTRTATGDPDTDSWDFSQPASGDPDGAASILRLYAQWEKADTTYTVRVWKENLTSIDHETNNAKHESGTVDYLLADFRSISAQTGTVIDVAKDTYIQNYISEEAKKSSFSTYQLKADQTTPDSFTVKGDGTSVVNIYFDLKVYTVQFRAFQDGFGGHSGDILFYYTADGGYYRYNLNGAYAVTFEAGGNQYSVGQIYSFQARIGEDISGVWPDFGTAKISATDETATDIVSFADSLAPYSWRDETADAQFNAIISFVSHTQSRMSKKFISADPNVNTHTYCLSFIKDPVHSETHYRYQKLDDLTDFSDDDVRYRDMAAGNNNVANSNAAYTLLDKAPEGFPDTDRSKYIWYFYFIRNHITLYYYNYSGLDRVYEGDGSTQTASSGGWGEHKIDYPGVLYGTPLDSGEYNYTPQRPEGLPENYVFQGWYTTEDLSGDPFDFNTTMGSKPLTLYAKWAAVPVTVTFDSNGGSEVESQTIQYAESPEKPADPVREGYTFGGWVRTNGTPFSFSEQITEDTTLVAKWVEFDQKIRVVYDAGAGSNVPKDPALYSDTSCAVVKKAPTAPEGMYFTGWNYRGTTVNYGDLIQLKSTFAEKQEDGTYTVTLTAMYDGHEPATLTYYANNGTDQNAKVVLPNNSGLKIAQAESFLFSLAGYRFTGWNTQPDGSGNAYSADSIVAIDHNTPNRLYAQWEKIPETESETGTETESEIQSEIQKVTETQETTETQAATEAQSAVSTGDETNLRLYLAMCLIAVAIVFSCSVYSRRRRER